MRNQPMQMYQSLQPTHKEFAKPNVSPSKVKRTISIETMDTLNTKETEFKANSSASFFVQSIRNAFQNSCCMANNKGLMLCTNAKCEHIAVVCSEIQCVCKEKHRRCFTAQIDGFLERYEEKVRQQEKFIKEIENFFDKLIDQISQFNQSMVQNIKGAFVTPQDISFLKIIQNEEFKNLKGKDLKKVFENLEVDEEMQKENAKMTQLLSQLQEIADDSTESFKELENSYKRWRNESTQDSKKEEGLAFESLKLKKIDTDILKNNEEVAVLSSFFNKKPVKKLNLLYRASESNFLVSEFYEKCNNIPHTLILIKTEDDKIIGGYTPLPWKKYETASYQLADPSKESFLFSVTEGDKFTLEKPEYATYYLDSSPGPRFGKNGYADLWICNKANSSNLSYVFGEMAYQNKNYEQNYDSYVKFLGGETEYFRTLEWQVFQVLFE